MSPEGGVLFRRRGGADVLCSDFVDEYQVCLGAVLLMGVDVAFDDSHVVFVLQGLPSSITL